MRKTFTYICIAIISLTLGYNTEAQAKKVKALFIGNSYTDVNNLPQIVADFATSMGDTLIWDKEAPGGQTFEGHYTSASTKNKIMQGGWDYVVLQEQSQRPSFPISQVESDVYPYAHLLDSLVHKYSPCATTVFYMTWGRKNGDAGNCAGWPPVCTYLGMDSLLRERYMEMAVDNKATVSPVGAVWRYMRANHGGIELYQADESHPSAAGSYAAACAFYTTLFKRSPVGSTYNYSLSAAEATTIRNAAKTVVFDSMSKWQIGTYELVAGFSNTASGKQVNFTNTSKNATSYNWNFGDGQTATAASPTHTYTASGSYNVRLIATGASCSDTIYMTLTVVGTGISNTAADKGFTIAPNPAGDICYIQSELFQSDDYQISLINSIGQLVHETQSNRMGNELSLKGFAPGTYIVLISNNKGQVYRQKLAKL